MCELATWMLDEGYSSIVLTHAAEFAEEKGVPAKWIALVGAIIGAVIAFSVLLVVPTHPLLCLVNRAGRLAIALTKTGTSLSPASLLSSKNSRSDVNADNKNCLLQVVKDYKEIVILFAPLVCCFFLYQDNVKMRQDMLKLQQDQAHATLKISEAMAQQVELIRRIDYTVTSSKQMNVIIAIDKQDKVLTNIASNLVELLDKELLNPSLDIVPLTRDVNLFMSNRWDNMKVDFILVVADIIRHF